MMLTVQIWPAQAVFSPQPFIAQPWKCPGGMFPSRDSAGPSHGPGGIAPPPMQITPLIFTRHFAQIYCDATHFLGLFILVHFCFLSFLNTLLAGDHLCLSTNYSCVFRSVKATAGSALVEHYGKDIPPYAILSHTRGIDNEGVTFKDILKGKGKSKLGRL